MRLIRKLINKFSARKSDPPAVEFNWKPIVVFVPQAADCAVDRTYELLQPLATEGYALRKITTDAEAAALFGELQRHPVRLAIFGHFLPHLGNLLTASGQQLRITLA